MFNHSIDKEPSGITTAIFLTPVLQPSSLLLLAFHSMDDAKEMTRCLRDEP